MRKIFTVLLIILFVTTQTSVSAIGINGTKISAQMEEHWNGYDTTNLVGKGVQPDTFDNNYQTIERSSLSPIEQMFNDEKTNKTKDVLRQVGYHFTSPQTAGNSTGKYDNNYKLSVGQKLTVYMYGDSVDVMAISGSNLLSPTITTEVDSKGNIFIQGVGVVKAENKSISEVESAIQTIASKKYSNLKVKINVASGQAFSVYVYGHVNRPGQVFVSSNASVVEALGAAGGVKKTGSLRNIKYISNHKIKTVDLYQTLLVPSSNDVILKANDKIFVEPIGNVIAIKNGVKIPGIYEAKANETLDKMIYYAGGLLPGTQNTEVVMTSINSQNKERVAKNVDWVNASKTKIGNGDSVEFKGSYNEVENTVTIQGNIKHPATYAYKPGMRLSDILKSENELLEETFLSQAVIRRITGKDNTVETIPVFLKEFFAGTSNPELKPRDVISIYKNTNALFVDIYGCVSSPKHITYTNGMTLADVMSGIKFVEYNIDNSENNVENNVNKEVKNVNLSSEKAENKELILEGNTISNNKLLSADDVAVEITRDKGDIQLYYLYDIMVVSNSINSITLNPDDKIFFRPLRDNETVKTVKVSGFVKNPGVFKFVDGKKLTDMIEMAGGITKDADLRGLVLTRKAVKSRQVEMARKNNERDMKLIEGRMATQYVGNDNSLDAKEDVLKILQSEQKTLSEKYNGQIALNIKTINDVTKIKAIDNLYIQDGDSIYIPRVPYHVNVIGEVYNEMAFVYVKNSNAKKYIKEIGGYTPNANRFKLYRIKVNGRAERISQRTTIEPGDTIIVPRKVSKNEWIDPITKCFASIANVAIAVMAVFNVNK